MVGKFLYVKLSSPHSKLPGANRKKLAQSEPKLVASLVNLMDSPSLKVQCQSALALRNLASDGASLFSHNEEISADISFREISGRDCQG